MGLRLHDPDHAREKLERKTEVLSNQLARVRGDLALLDRKESAIRELEGKVQQDRKNLAHIATGLEAAKFDDDVKSVSVTNIQQVQTPSPPAAILSLRSGLVGAALIGFLAAVAVPSSLSSGC